MSAARDIVDKLFKSYSKTPEKEEVQPVVDAPQSNAKCYFVEVSTYSCGSVFSLGEEMEDRIILAKSKGLQCLTVPRYWLFEKNQNRNNVWQR